MGAIKRSEAYARLVSIKYYKQINEFENGETKIYTILPRKYLANKDVVSPSVQGDLKDMGEKGYVVDRPIPVMEQLMGIKPFSTTYDYYKNKYTTPEHLFLLNDLAEKGVYYETYFIPSMTVEGDRHITIDNEEYKEVSMAKIQLKNSVLEKYTLEREGQTYLAVMELFEERPPRRGLLWKEGAVAKFEESYIYDAVRLMNLSSKAFKPVRNLVKATEAKGKRYLLYHEVWKNPVLGIDRDKFFVLEISGNYAKKGYIDKSVVSSVDTLSKLLRKHGLDAVKKGEINDEYESEERVEKQEMDAEEEEQEEMEM